MSHSIAVENENEMELGKQSKYESTYNPEKLFAIPLLQYVVSFRDHEEFHERCVERIFTDIRDRCAPARLTVSARYTRRGGLDINPIRSSELLPAVPNMRLVRQ